MKGSLFLLAFAMLPLVGLAPLLLRRLAWMPAWGLLPVSTGIGAVVLCVEMLGLAVVSVRWTIPLLISGPVLLLCVVLARRGPNAKGPGRPGTPITAASAWLLFVVIASVALAAYAAMTARVTSTDLLYFWGIKGEHFGLARRIDGGWLREHAFVNADYPPLLPCLYGLGTSMAGRLAWGATLATLPLFLGLSAMTIRAFTGLRGDSFQAAGFAAVFSSMYAYLFCVLLTAGNADPALLFFETLALCLIVFARERRGASALAGVALAGAALTKLEGIAFSLAVIAAYALAVRPLKARHFIQLAAPALAATAAWIAFCRVNGIVSYIAPRALFVSADRARVIASGMLSAARFESAYAPWIVAILILALRRPTRETVFCLLVAAAVAAFDFGVYFTSPIDPTQWIGWAAARTLMTPLLALLMAGMSGGNPERR